VTRGIRPDRPTAPPPPPAAPPPPASPAGSTTPAAKREPIISKVLALPSDWDGQRTLNELAQGLKRLADARLPEHRFIFSVADSGQRYVRVEWKAREYEAPAGPAATASGQTATAGTSAETGPTPKKKGPAEDGLLLTAWLETRLTEADRPRTFDNAGLWKTRNDQAYLIPLRTYLKFNVHYGENTAADLVAAFSTPREWFAGALPKDSQPTVETRIAVPTEAVPTFVPGSAQAQPSSGSAGIAPDRPPAGTLGIQPDRPAR
jgi:hypothetical protein